MRLLVWMISLLAPLVAQEVVFVTMTPGGIPKVHEGAANARRRTSPCSTFKIPNSAIGLESGVISSPSHVLPFDEKKHKTTAFWLDVWSKDHDLRTAFRNSTVWYYREIANRNGPGTMKNFVDRFEYGNRDTSGFADPFWIGSTLRISPIEQVEFLDKFFANRFGLQPSTVAALEDLMRQQEKGGKTLYYKTGACTDRDAGPGVWLVGFVQEGKQRTFFAMNAGGQPMDTLIPKRIDLAVERLIQYGYWPR